MGMRAALLSITEVTELKRRFLMVSTHNKQMVKHA
jgi:hypothetical protein